METIQNNEIIQTSRRTWLYRSAIVLVLAVHFALLVFSARQKSVVMDEPFHIARGASTLFSGDFRMNVAHPPLVNLITALPLLAFSDLQVPFNDTAWHDPRVDPAERKFRFSWLLLWVRGTSQWRGNADPLQIIFWCRIPVMIMSAALGLLIFIWSKKLFGTGAGLAALILYCFSPTVLAHSRLVTTETGSALFILLFAITLSEHLTKPSWKTLVLCGITFGLAQLSKYTAILLIPLVPLVLITAYEGTPYQRLKRFLVIHPGKPHFLTGIGAWIVIMVTCALVIWAGYGFEINSIHSIHVPDPVPLSDTGTYFKRLAVKFLASIPILPRTYYYGLARTLMDTAAHTHPLYFMGEIRDLGRWYYYPVLFVIKEPLCFLGLLAIGLLCLKKPPLPKRAPFMIILIFFAGIILFFMFLNQKNIGIRHLLPAYPFLIIWLSRLVRVRAWRGFVSWGAWALIGIYTANAFVSYPDYLVHFNSSVGGPQGGLRYSVVGEDWGQDVSALGEYCRENRIKSIHYNIYGVVDPAAYGVPYVKFKCDSREKGLYALHLVDMLRPRKEKHDCYEHFLSLEPEAVLHHTIYVYRLDGTEEFP